jgi:periplasmic protein CpxP/Spy
MLHEWLKKSCHRRGRHLMLGLALLAVAGAGVAWAGQRAWPTMCHRMGGGMMRLHVEFVVDRALKQVDATDEQRQKIETVVQRLMAQHETLRAQHEQVHQEVVAILSAEKVDRARLETLRAQQVARIDQVSREIVQAVGDAADVLTPEQRKKLIDWAQEMHK